MSVESGTCLLGMKRARHSSQQGQPEPSLKRTYQEQLTFATLDTFSNDFWFDTLKYLTSWSIWKLSCVSKSLNALAWNLLIPNYTGGIRYHPSLPLETLEMYLSRVHSLKKLDFSECASNTPLTLLTKLTNLSTLLLPYGRPQWDVWGPRSGPGLKFPFKSISHLTNLEELHSLPTDDENTIRTISKFLRHFTGIKSLHVDVPLYHPMVQSILNDMPQLELFNFRITSARECNFSQISKLSNLKDLGLHRYAISPPINGHELVTLTNLTRLGSFTIPPGLKSILSSLTGLTDLHLTEGISPNQHGVDYLDEISRHLTNLKSLFFSQPSEDDHHLDSLSSLKNLEFLHIRPKWLKPQNLTVLDRVQQLEFPIFQDFEDAVAICFNHRDFTSLKELNIWTKHLKIFHRMTNLQVLDLSLPTGVLPGSTTLVDLGNLQHLHTLVLYFESSSTYDLSPLQVLAPSLTSLSLSDSLENPQGQDLQSLTCLKNLKFLELPRNRCTQPGIQAILHFSQLQVLKFIDPIERARKRELPAWRRLEESRWTLPRGQQIIRPLIKLTRLEFLVVTPEIVENFWKEYYEYYNKQNRGMNL